MRSNATRGLLTAIAIGTVAATMAACASGGGSGSPSASAPAPATAPATASQATYVWSPVDGDLNERLVSAGFTDPLRVATDLAIGYPWAAVKDDGTTPDGLNVDLTNALGEVLGAETSLENTSFDTFIPGLVAGRYDFSVSAMLDNKERQQQVDFVDFLSAASGFLVAQDSELSDLTLADTCGMVIGVLRGSVDELVLTEQNTVCENEGKPAVDVQVFQQADQGQLAVTAGRIEAWLGDNVSGGYLASQPDSGFRMIGEPIGEAPVGMAITKDSALVELLQQALQELIDNGAYAAILDKWGQSSGAVEAAVINGGTS